MLHFLKAFTSVSEQDATKQGIIIENCGFPGVSVSDKEMKTEQNLYNCMVDGRAISQGPILTQVSFPNHPYFQTAAHLSNEMQNNMQMKAAGYDMQSNYLCVTSAANSIHPNQLYMTLVPDPNTKPIFDPDAIMKANSAAISNSMDSLSEANKSKLSINFPPNTSHLLEGKDPSTQMMATAAVAASQCQQLVSRVGH